jgi:serine/threonine protein kinase
MLVSLSFLALLVCHFHGLSHAAVPAAGGGGDERFIYNGFAGAGLDLDGMAAVEPDGKLRLTNVTSQLKGHAFHPAPLRFHDEAPASASAGNRTARSFSTTFVFAIAAEYVTVSGNGLAFFVAPTKNLTAASPSQFLGLFNSENNGNASNHVFAVELDTILNPEFRDINSNHVGVDVNGLMSVAAEPAGYFADDTGVFKNLSLYSGDAMQVWVDYDGRAAVVNVTLAPAEAPKPKKPLISVAVDLSAVVNGTAYVGLSSSTGPFRTRHYVLGWSFALGGAAPTLDYAKLPKMPRAVTKRRPRALDVALPVAMPLLALAAVACVSVLAWRRFRYAELREDWEVEFGPHRFSYKDLFHATDGFDSKHLLGAGGFGRVYKGVLPESKTEVAVKVVSHDARQGMKQFVAEVVSIGRLRHRNVVKLLGYCRRRGELLLVYDYMPNGSLDRWLYGHGNGAPPLSWEQRLRAVRGVASGLLYLHEDWEQVVIHRDVKASNVLLDGEMNARLGDFGLARLYERGAGPQTTHVVGTMGYLAPELARTRRVTPAADVFAFGAFVLEVACGRRPIERGGGGNDDGDGRFVLVDWVLELWHMGALADATDPRLRGDYPAEDAALVLMLGLLCSHPVPGERPSMRQVVQYLDGDAPLPEPPRSYQSFTALAMMQNEGFDSYAASYPSSSATVTSAGAVSSFHSGGT